MSGASVGWQAFLFAMSPVFGSGVDAGIVRSSLMVTSALTNVLYIGAMVRASIRHGSDERAAGWALAGASLLNMVWPTYFDMAADPRMGY